MSCMMLYWSKVSTISLYTCRSFLNSLRPLHTSSLRGGHGFLGLAREVSPLGEDGCKLDLLICALPPHMWKGELYLPRQGHWCAQTALLSANIFVACPNGPHAYAATRHMTVLKMRGDK